MVVSDARSTVCARSRRRVSMGIGERLLRGWTLMAECCPRCVHTPLVKSRQGDMFCVCCDMDVKAEGSTVGVQQSSTSVAASPVKTAVQSPGASVVGVGAGRGADRIAALAPSALNVSQRLQADSVSSSPAKSFSPLRSLADPSKVQNLSPPPPTVPSHTADCLVTDVSKASSAIAQKLLLGWTLLGETCPVDGCLVPLMLDPKTLIKHCVNADVCGFCDSQLGPALTFSEDNKDDNVTRAAITTPSRDAALPPASRSREPRTSPRLGSAGVGASPTRGGLLLSAADVPVGGMLSAGQGSQFAPDESTVLLAARKVHMCMHGRMWGCTLYESVESCVGGVVFRLCVWARGTQERVIKGGRGVCAESALPDMSSPDGAAQVECPCGHATNEGARHRSEFAVYCTCFAWTVSDDTPVHGQALLNKVFAATEALASSADVKKSSDLVGLLAQSLSALQTLDALAKKE